MKLAFDVDGVLADFDRPFQKLLSTTTGRPCPPGEVPTWKWPELYGYTKPEIDAAWKIINNDPTWWRNLRPCVEPLTFSTINGLLHQHDIYFITARHGDSTKYHTERWLLAHNIWNPTVVLAKAKGVVCAALKIDAVLDDKFSNCVEMRLSAPRTRCYLRERPMNTEHHAEADSLGILRTKDAQTFLNDELKRLQ